MSGKRLSRPVSSKPQAWIRSNILGLVAIFIALSGSAAAATVVIKHDSKGSATAKASKKAKAGPRGPAGATGATGAAGPQGVRGPAGDQGPGALRLQFSQLATDGQVRVLGTVNELTLSAVCHQGGATTRPLLFLYAQSSVEGAAVAGTSSETEDFGLVTTSPIATGVSTAAATTQLLALIPDDVGHLHTSFLHATFFTANRAISIDLYAIANSAIDHAAVEVDSCEVHGTAVAAS